MSADIELQRIRFLRGPNVWTYRPVLETWVDLKGFEERPSHTIPGFVDRLLASLPALLEHQCGVGEPGGFVQRLHEGTWLGHVLEHIVIELLNLAGQPTGFGQTRSTSRPGVYRMVFRARDERVARAALEQAFALMRAAIDGQPFDVDAAVKIVHDALDRFWFGPSTGSIVAAATERGIPHIRLNEGNLVQLGHGARSRRIWTAETDATSAVAESIAGDKTLTKELIGAAGVPVPAGEEVGSADAAWAAAQELGLPVVVKPTDGNHGRGVALDLTNEADVRAAFDIAERHGSGVLVEHCIPGHEHRLLVVGGHLVAAARGDVATVTGDGVHSVRELVDRQLNTDERRGDTEHHPLALLRLTDDENILADLARQGLAVDAVPAHGRVVLIQRNGNVSVDCTDEVHPEVAHAVELAARTVGLDIAGVDVVATDIGRPLQETGGAIVEVNAGPGLLMHLRPAQGTPRPVGRAIVDHLFGPARDSHDHAGGETVGRIPIVGVSGSKDGCETTRLIGWLLQLSGRHTGVASADGLRVDRRRIEACDGTQWEAAERLLINRTVQAAVFQHTARGILDDGLPYDRCRIGVVTDLDGFEGLQDHDVAGRDGLPRVLRTQVDVVLDDGAAVLDGDDEDVAALGRHCDGEVLLYATSAASPAVVTHLRDGGRAVIAAEGQLWLHEGERRQAIAALPPEGEHLPLRAVLAMAGCGVALGIAPELIGAALATWNR